MDSSISGCIPDGHIITKEDVAIAVATTIHVYREWEAFAINRNESERGIGICAARVARLPNGSRMAKPNFRISTAFFA